MKRDNLVWGIILIGLGVAFLLNQLFPGLFGWFEWPWILIGLGGIFVLASLIGRVGGLMVPGVILLGLGGIFFYQTRTGNWDSWAYVWALMPALAGLGMLIGSLYDDEMRPARPAGAIMLVGGLAAFLVFGAAFTGLFGLSADILRFWPVLLILLGLGVLVQAMRREK